MKLDRKQRITLVCTVVWLIIILTIAMRGDDPFIRAKFDLAYFVNFFLLIGVLPAIIIWGIIWIMDAPSKKKRG